MFKSITLKAFRKHEDLHVNFESGLIAIRGRNEAGKSSLQEAIAYALFGSKGLRQSFDEVVTWGRAESELEVSLELVNDLSVTRSKKGAEVRRGAAVLCTGQKECTRYFEQMLGTTADMGANLMLAGQNQLRGALEGGSAAAAELIETLADFNLIDRVVALIQAELPSGRTHEAEEGLRVREAQLAELPDAAIDTAFLETAVVDFNCLLGNAYETQKRLSFELNKLDVAAARRHMVLLNQIDRDLDALAPQLAATRLAAELTVVSPSAGADVISEWRAQIMNLKGLSARREAYAALMKIQEPELMWDGQRKDFRVELERLASMLDQAQAEKNDLQLRRQAAVLQKITEKACAFCGKDLSAVPEVELRNAAADNTVRVINERLGLVNMTISGVGAQRQELLELDIAANEHEAKLNRYAAFITLYPEDRYPARWEWQGELPTSDGPAVDYNALIQGAEMAQRLYQRELGAQQAAQAQLQILLGQQQTLQSRQQEHKEQAPAVAGRIAKAELLEASIRAAGREMEDHKTAVTSARHELELVQLKNSQAKQDRDRLLASIATSRDLLTRVQFNNVLLKRVREARPAIADKLWAIVLAAVSQHFSQIRGVQSVITRSGNGFQCDGHAVQSQSGSTLDALGLAIRIALTKTFLPNSRFMMLDEPGAATDDERESNMLGLIAASDFDQILLVTHSALADSFAAQVVTL